MLRGLFADHKILKSIYAMVYMLRILSGSRASQKSKERIISRTVRN